MIAATPLADQFTWNFATMCPKGIKRSQKFWRLGERVLEFWLPVWWRGPKSAPPPPVGNRVKVFLHFQSLCFSKIVPHRLKSTMETLSFTFLGIFFIYRQCWVSQDASDVSYTNGWNIPTQMILEVDALPRYWRVNKFWRFRKSSCKIMTDNSSASPSLLFGMIFVHWFLFSSSVEKFCSNPHCAAAITWLFTSTNFSVFWGWHIVFNLYTKLTEKTWIRANV